MATANSPRLAARRIQSRIRAQERRAAGQCGKCSKPAMPGRALCLDCWQRGRANKKCAYEWRRAGRLCQTCVNQITNGQSRCPDCPRKATENTRINRRK